ncbi:phage tail protein [Flavobacterium amnicola]|uniref:Phage tail protein n=1 Tax=Flavobacterium amnicola TaxID=2506422 RepID=A0A4Q1K9J7_9FLAO|nr:tail fiber protein [Flavobacterium amnicola]RXR21289.1 phage tail protein [Flavobacterium amnicola]
MKKYLYSIITLFFVGFGQVSYGQDDPMIGEIQIFAGNFAPRGWAFCNGQLLSIASNTALFSLLGTTYGGNGQTTFALPDLRGRVPVHPNNTAIVQGQMAGTEANSLTINNLPAHSHTINGVTTAGNQNLPTGNLPAETATLDPEYSNAVPNAFMASGVMSPAGGSQPINNIQPSAGCMYIIALQGIFPSRN